MDARVGVVVVTRDRRRTTLDSLAKLLESNPGAPVTVVDNASTDGTADAVADRYPEVTVVRLPANLGAAGRNSGVAVTPCPYIAFADDDSWWAPDALDRAAACLDHFPRIGLLAARILVGPDERLDPTCEMMRDSPLPRDAALPGPRILGFVACGAVVRRSAFLDAGGFPERYAVGGEEQPLAMAMACGGWELVYVDDVVAHHHPATVGRNPAVRRRHVAGNALRTTWRQLSGLGLVTGTAAVLRDAATDRATGRGVVDAVRDLPWILRTRRPVTPEVEAWRRLLV
jgi:GT2 family glycosyltransferase